MDNSTLDLMFPAGGVKEVVSRNDGCDITSDAGLLLICVADKKLGLTAGVSDNVTNRHGLKMIVYMTQETECFPKRRHYLYRNSMSMEFDMSRPNTLRFNIQNRLGY